MGFIGTIRGSASALSTQRLRMDVIANNIANIDSTRSANGGPYRRQVVTVQAAGTPENSFLAALNGQLSGPVGVRAASIEEDQSPLNRVYDPAHPDADKDGFVLKPNVDLVTEMTDLVAAQRAYEASVTVLNSIKAMAMKALEIGRR